ncbi:MAG TPA: MBL fold metallo-hydrolase [Bryobacteraceae bacterium]|nr:MBL fold metallo-hydrolase [Bryobacteraceae bacterium]
MAPVAVTLAAVVLLGTLGVLAQQNQNFDNVEVHVLPVQGNVYMLVGAGGNITMQAAKDGVLLVDTSFAPMAPKILAAIKTVTARPLRYIVNTHVHADHTGGNEALAKAGSIIAGGNFAGNVTDIGETASIIAHERVQQRMAEQKPALPFGMLPTNTYFTASKELFFNGEAIQILHMPAAHTDGDSIVFFRRSDVVSAGDIFTPGGYPVVDIERGGSINGLIAALNRIIEITIPADKQEGGTYVIPGHGRLCDEADVVEYRDMATIVRDRIQDLIKRGMTLEQVRTAKPTRDYDPLYGSTTGFWTTDKFVDAVYSSLTKTKTGSEP